VLAVLLASALVRAEEKKDPAEELQKDTIWSGQTEPDPRLVDRKVKPARFRVLSRDEQKFTARYTLRTGKGPLVLELEGVTKNGQISAKVMQVSVTVPDKQQVFGPFTATLGATGPSVRCQ
jgi:hypothetical protein